MRRRKGDADGREASICSRPWADMLGVIFTLCTEAARRQSAADVSWMQNLYQATFEIALLAFPPLFFITRLNTPRMYSAQSDPLSICW
jgi:hypothetical protein